MIITALAASVLPTASAAGATNPQPPTIPALPEWSAASGTFALRPGSRIVIDRRHRAELITEARTLASDLERLRGRRPRIWHDGLEGGSAVEVDHDVIVEWWSNHAGPPPQELIAEGHQVLNAGWFPTYYVNGALGSVRPDMRSAYESWEVNEFYGPFVADETLAVPPHTLAPGEPANRGSLLHVWNDDPEAATEEEIEAGIAPRLRVIAQKTWSSPRVTDSYAEFERLEEAVGGAP